MASITIAKQITGQALAVSGSAVVSDAEGVNASPTTVPVAQLGTLTTRASNIAGTLTMTSGGHTIITGQRIDLYWTGGACYGATVGTVSGTSVPFTAVTGGTVLPSTSTAITVGVCTKTAMPFTGSNLAGLAFGGGTGLASYRSYFIFEESDNTTDDFAALLLAGDAYAWYTGCNVTNPLLSKSIDHVWMSHENSVAAVTTMLAIAATH